MTVTYLVPRYAIVQRKLEHVFHAVRDSIVGHREQRFSVNRFSLIRTIDHLETDAVKYAFVQAEVEQQTRFSGAGWRQDVGHPFRRRDVNTCFRIRFSHE